MARRIATWGKTELQGTAHDTTQGPWAVKCIGVKAVTPGATIAIGGASSDSIRHPSTMLYFTILLSLLMLTVASAAKVDRAACVASCNIRGHCCTDASSVGQPLNSECGHPSCAMGCALAADLPQPGDSMDADGCKVLCVAFDAAQNCSFSYGGDQFHTCQGCPSTCGDHITPKCAGATSVAGCLLGCDLAFHVVKPLAEPFPALHGFNATGNPPRPHSPDPLVRYTWPASDPPTPAVNLTQLQTFPIAVARAAVAQPAAAFTGVDAWIQGGGTGGGGACNITVHRAGWLRLDFGVETAGWLEFTSPDLTPSEADLHVTASVSEFDEPYVPRDDGGRAEGQRRGEKRREEME